ncbi:uncharacterized protein MELLADRAFT_87652 [Melampsora larici-populina 98AG31]|uniref:Uncharacterized protein n=1 Tax=Melampsora larici-populina (strain 98AG31 / pathotype 3-4-7) TaxID=747676 RepID=F4RP76_MELLP|nr:uncharacterized protein MELLADRAFT_87652 [Melampsora larici-populina 98AG31]EGG05898.1 hypothetical protein MELLADRAFT_87652 [Melampsora larici-populina 98AG31]
MNPLVLKPLTPPSFDEDHLHGRKDVRDEEVYRLKQRVNQLEFLNGMMKSKISRLESADSKRVSWDGSCGTTAVGRNRLDDDEIRSRRSSGRMQVGIEAGEREGNGEGMGSAW